MTRLISWLLVWGIGSEWMLMNLFLGRTASERCSRKGKPKPFIFFSVFPLVSYILVVNSHAHNLSCLNLPYDNKLLQTEVATNQACYL